MSLTVRFARSFHERSQRTGPDDPSEIKCAGLPTPPRKRALAGRRPGPYTRSGNPVIKKQGYASNSGEVCEAEPCPENPQTKPRPAAVSSQCCGADLQVRAGPPGPAPNWQTARSPFPVLSRFWALLTLTIGTSSKRYADWNHVERRSCHCCR